MIFATHRVTEIRFCDDAVASAPMPPFSLSCNLIWESPTVVWITMMVGEFKRHHVRELAAWLRERGVVLVKAHRAPGHTLPGFAAVNGHFEREVK